MKVVVYDLEGQPHEKESVDSRECCQEMGWSMTPPETQENTPGEPTREAMKTFLDVNGVTYPKNISTRKLTELFTETKAKAEAE